MTKILVTGASGFIGSHVVAALSEAGENVRALYRNNEPVASLKALPGVEWMRCDLLDVYDVEDALKGIDAIIHCAATVSFDAGDAEAILHNNSETTANVVNEALVQNISRFIHVSSVAALGRTKLGKPITEAEEWEDSKANSVYARSKRAAELEVWRGAGEGLSAAMVNPGIVLGEPYNPTGWNSGSAALFRTVDKEFPFYTEGVNAWVDVKDVAKAILLLLKSDIQDERFILSGGNWSYREVFTQMAQALGRKPPHISANPFLTGLVWRWNALRKIAGKRPTVTKETARTAQQQVFYEASKFPNAFPDFRYTPLEETIRRSAAAYKQHA
jgi:nucleoside-diphosphate-sugar epimerase